ncbi:MAG TPA: ParB/RepB/Spo0J family partition protein [Pyrinomonadaceae bacterium]|nr:ParB/RepB/Spo0J family partition protein [Pyrinomonadaceae bacterium]
MVRQPLGRGLSSLLGDESPKEGTFEIDIDQIEPNKDQPRTRFSEPELEELAASIKANGVVQPIVVRKKGGRYQIVAGERRWRAAQRAGLRKIAAVVRDVADDKMLELALIENIQRQELNPIEEAYAYRKLIDTIGLTQEMLAERVGRERSLIATSLRLLKLPSDVHALIEEGKLSAGHGRALLMAEGAAAQSLAAKTIVRMSLSVREAERIVRQLGEKAQKPKATGVSRKRDANLVSAESKLRRKLGTNVRISPSKSGPGGKVEIDYYSSDDLVRIYDAIMIDKV